MSLVKSHKIQNKLIILNKLLREMILLANKNLNREVVIRVMPKIKSN